MLLTANKLNKKILSPVVILLSILSGVFFLVLFSSVRCEPDDMIMAIQLRENSLMEILINRYNQESFRPLYPIISFFTLGYRTIKINTVIFLYYLSVWSLFIFSIYKLLKEVFSLGNSVLLLCFAQLFFTVVYFITTERIEIFGWLSASIIHLIPTVFIIICTWLIIKKQTRKADFLLLFICAFFITGGAEHIGLIINIILIVVCTKILNNKKYQKEWGIEDKQQIRKCFFLLLTTILFFLICTTNRGLWFRYNDITLYTMQHNETYHFSILDVLKMFCKLHKTTGIVLLVSTWILFQSTLQIKLLNTKNYFYIIISLIVFSLTCLVLILIFKTLNVGRIWFLFDVTIVVLLSIYILKMIQKIRINKVAFYSISLFIVSILIMFDIRHIPALLNYASQHDKIISSLQQKNSGEIIVLEGFPKPDLTNQVTLSDDPNNDVNQLFCRFYNIKAKISVKK
jgi:uncharacterized protein DUF6056